MTAEIAILNKSSVALAADSAMTLDPSGKTYTGNKLFALSKWHPVGLMIYHNAAYMGIPWETIVKMYRREIGKNSKPTVREYVEDFLAFICDSRFCTENQTTKNFLNIAYDLFIQISRTVRDKHLLCKLLNDKHRSSKTNLHKKFQQEVDSKLQRLQEDLQLSDSMEEIDAKQLVSEHRERLDELINNVFAGMNITKSTRESLYSVLQFSVKSAELSSNHTGIVIAGFGDEEIFPALYEVTVDGILDKTLKFNLEECCVIGEDSVGAALIPFAQVDMVKRFMEGVDPKFLNYLELKTEFLLQEFGKIILSELDLGDNQSLEIVESLSNKMMSDYFNSLNKFRCKEFIQPITEIIQFLPNEELGGMAEAMVNLTSLKRRVSFELETVGGPRRCRNNFKRGGLYMAEKETLF